MTALLASLLLAASPPLVQFETYTLPNGLTVILTPDHRLPTVGVNLWYHVGAANETPGRSGFAHLFEHLMFQGSKHRQGNEQDLFGILEAAGASDINASTTYDRTNYFETLPANRLELALWLESERMAFLLDGLEQTKLDTQREVVRNERRQSVENTPYGKAEVRIVELLFPKPHPYFGAVIGSHEDLQAATLEDVKSFFRTYYVPANASLVIVGVIAPSAWSDEGFAYDLLQEILSAGKTSRLYRALVFDRDLAQEVDMSTDKSTFGSSSEIRVTLKPGHLPAEAEAVIDAELDKLLRTPPSAAELQ